MAKYLFHGSYTQEGVRGLIKEGGTSRRAFIEKLVASSGGKVEAFYYAFGGDDFYIISDLPDNVGSAALSLAVNASGAARTSVVVLITPEDTDLAAKKAATMGYRPPGR
jgi:uncharacterized protein with GYD domain